MRGDIGFWWTAKRDLQERCGAVAYKTKGNRRIMKYKIKNWEDGTEEIVETNLVEFFDELFAIYSKYNISIAHEDGHGGFVLEKDNEFNRNWVLRADVEEYLELNLPANSYVELVDD